MTGIIVFVLIAGVAFFTRKMWGNFIVKMFKQRPSVRDEIQSEKRSVFSAMGTVRTFALAIDLKEMGDGKVQITCRQLKNKDIELP